MTPRMRPPSARPSGVPPDRAMRSTAARKSGGSRDVLARLLARELEHRVDRALAQLAVADLDAGQPRHGRKRDEFRRLARAA